MKKESVKPNRLEVNSIWILDSPLFKDAGTYHLKFGLHDSENKISLSDHLTIHLLQLSLFDEHKNICNETERWLYFFKQAENQDINSLPDVLKTKEMRQAMETLQDFDRKLQNTMMSLEVERQEKEKALKEKDLYLKILKEKGIDIDSLSEQQSC